MANSKTNNKKNESKKIVSKSVQNEKKSKEISLIKKDDGILNLSKTEKAKYVTIAVSALVMLLSILGYTYSFFSATINNVNKSQTAIKTKEINLIFKGTKEVEVGSIVPGNTKEKTFSVENPTNSKLTYNIYIENVTNEFNEDLVYVLRDDNGQVVEETPLPETTSGKKYILTNIEINGKETQNYTMTIEFKYSETKNQDAYQGAQFSGTLGIDASQIKILASAVAYANAEYTECTDVECSLDELYDQIAK